MAIDYLKGLTTALAVLPQLYVATKGIVESVEQDGIVKAGEAKKSHVLAVVGAGLQTADNFEGDARTSDEQKQGILGLTSVLIDSIVGFKKLVNLFS